jgi:chemotaxis methyl-accepting protein methylase
VCEHLLVYFHRLAVEQTVERLVAALAPEGVLMVSPAEAHLLSRARVRAVEVLPRGFFARTAGTR